MDQVQRREVKKHAVLQKARLAILKNKDNQKTKRNLPKGSRKSLRGSPCLETQRGCPISV
ncbi:MAG: hypothetical protein OXE77_10250 [Flavobacteriaceae bacterium]|nr:hypothetical protein [Flavobacteriaceae bacterium]